MPLIYFKDLFVRKRALIKENELLLQNEGRLFAIGDVHGHSDELTRLLEKIQATQQDTIVMLGDVVNRGPDSKGVIDRLIDLKKQCKLVCILGNHEEAMLDARTNRHARSRCEEMGGFETLMSYGNEGRIKDIPEQHWTFLESFMPYHETDDFAFVLSIAVENWSTFAGWHGVLLLFLWSSGAVGRVACL